MTLLMQPAADTSVTPRLAAVVLSLSARWRSMTGGPAAANGIAIFSIAAQGSAAKNRSWERILSSGTAYLIDLLHQVGFACFPFASEFAAQKQHCPWSAASFQPLSAVSLTHQIIQVSTHTNKSKDVKYDERGGQVCGPWRTIQPLPLKYSVTRRQKCDGGQLCYRHV